MMKDSQLRKQHRILKSITALRNILSKSISALVKYRPPQWWTKDCPKRISKAWRKLSLLSSELAIRASEDHLLNKTIIIRTCTRPLYNKFQNTQNSTISLLMDLRIFKECFRLMQDSQILSLLHWISSIFWISFKNLNRSI